MEEQVRTQKGSDQARGTHKLETADGGKSQDTERKELREGNSQTVDHRGSYKSGCGKKAERGAHCCTDQLETAEGWISNDTERR